MDDMHRLAISDEELLSIAYNEGTLSAEKSEHLEHCSICQQRLAAYRQTNVRLLSKLYRSRCPSAVQLNYYCLGTMPEMERMNTASHILDCPLCTEEIEQIRHSQATFDPFPPFAFSLRTTVRRFFARPIIQQTQFNTRNRTALPGWPRQYRLESINLSLHLSSQPNGEMILLGIISSTDQAEEVNAFEGVTVDLYRAPGSSFAKSEFDQDDEEIENSFLSTQVDNFGNILLGPLPIGDYGIIVHLPDKEVIIQDLNLNHV